MAEIRIKLDILIVTDMNKKEIRNRLRRCLDEIVYLDPESRSYEDEFSIEEEIQ